MNTALRRIALALIAVLAGFFGTTSTTATAGPFPTWDDQINDQTRFNVLNEFNGKAVLDKETGLVWEQAPDTAEVPWASPFVGAVDRCYAKKVGGRAGWRLPTVEELNSLRDLGQTNLALPQGHPFWNVFGTYWSITTDASLPSRAYTVGFSGTLGGSIGVIIKSAKLRAWCVRGGHGHDGL